MTPLPKRKFSTMRSGKRKASRRTLLPAMVICKHCQKERLPHVICRACGKM